VASYGEDFAGENLSGRDDFDVARFSVGAVWAAALGVPTRATKVIASWQYFERWDKGSS
jgi:hypothetical protein